MRLVALLAVFLAASFWANATPVPIPRNCSVGWYGAGATAPGAAWTPSGGVPRGHAHNDYEHRRPLLDALDAGLTSVEADVWAVDGELLVAHARDEVDPARTLSSLYLRPLAEHFADVRDSPRVPTVQLLVDVKSAPSATLPLLRDQLASYAPVLTRYRGCAVSSGPVSVVVSGRHVRPAAPSPGTVSYFGYDMQPERARDTGLQKAITPLVSARWDAYFTWNGHGSLPGAERAELDDMVGVAHAAGSAIRFYNTPDDRGPARDAVWRQLVAAGVDYIGTDDLAGFRPFVRGLRPGTGQAAGSTTS